MKLNPNPSLGKGMTILSNITFCIIIALPGIGVSIWILVENKITYGYILVGVKHIRSGSQVRRYTILQLIKHGLRRCV